MLCNYSEITDLIPVPPIWWDEHGVPRYKKFGPSMIADIYADACCLMLIKCQQCGHEFNVSVVQHIYNRPPIDPQNPKTTLADLVRENRVEYGDPPNVGCCVSGASTCSVPVQVLEFWQKTNEHRSTWQRIPELEKDVTPDWVNAPYEP